MGSARRLIIDSQVHLWNGPWPSPDVPPQLPELFTVEKLLLLMNEAGVDRVVIVPPGGTNEYALGAAMRHPDRFGVMGVAPPPDSPGRFRMNEWMQQRGMLGIRTFFLGAGAMRLTDGSSDWLWDAAERALIPIMFLAMALGELAGIAKRHPELVLIIDHMGLSKQGVRAGMKESLIDTTVSLAKFPNISVKLSGFGAYSSEAFPWRDMTTHVHRVFDAYGPQRCYWGTDITNSFAAASYAQRVAHMEQLPFLSESDKDWILGRAILERLNWRV